MYIYIFLLALPQAASKRAMVKNSSSQEKRPEPPKGERSKEEQEKLLQRSIYEELASISKAMAQPIRLEIIDLLSQREHNVEELAQAIGTSHANLSHHLQYLKKARLVEVSKQGRQNLYRIPEKSVLQVWDRMRNLGLSRNAELERLLQELHGKNEEVAFSAEELKKKLEEEELVLVDVRPESEYEHGHIAEALSIPHDRIEEELNRLPKNKGIIAYCRGPFCVMSDKAVEVLRQNGYKVTSFQDGFTGWVEKGYPIEQGKKKSKG